MSQVESEVCRVRARHWDIFRELEYVVDFDGFVETCLDLRDNMLFTTGD